MQKQRLFHALLMVMSSLAIVLSAKSVAARDLTPFERPQDIPFAGVTAYSPQLATLGKMLFFDPRLSGAKNMNCVSCHNPSFGFEAPVALAIGAENKPLTRHAPTTLNMAWGTSFFMDGRSPTLEDQAKGPITAMAEMNISFEDLIPDLQAVDYYDRWFNSLFPGQGITEHTIVTALATYQRTIVSGWSPFDRWVEGDEMAVSEQVKQGFDLFVGKANCVACHAGWNFTDNQFHDIGLFTEDIGRGALEPDNPHARFAFKTPSLRNLTYRAPFMHNGEIDNLETVIAHYEAGFEQRPSLSPKMTSFSLSDQERSALLAFLQSLTADKIEPSFPILPN